MQENEKADTTVSHSGLEGRPWTGERFAWMSRKGTILYARDKFNKLYSRVLSFIDFTQNSEITNILSLLFALSC